MLDPSPGRLATQRRHVERCGALLGLSTPGRTAEQQAAVLDLGSVLLEQARSEYAAADLVHRSRGVLQVLHALDPHRDDRLLAAGHVAGLWGRPWWIDPQTGRRRSLPRRAPPTSLALSPVSGAS